MSKYAEIHEPVKTYNSQLKHEAELAIDQFFDKLVKESKVDIEQNKITVSKINKKEDQIDKLQNNLSKLRSWKILMIVLSVLFSIFSIIATYLLCKEWESWESLTKGLLLGGVILAVGLVITFIILITKVVNPKIRETDSEKKKNEDKRDKLIAEAYGEMHNLNLAFEWSDTPRIMSKLLPIVKLDSFVTKKRMQQFTDRGLKNLTAGLDETFIFAQSGTIADNPFLITKQLNHHVITKTYTGTLLISWTESYTDSQGKRQTRVRTQTLVANVFKPFPEYFVSNDFIFANDATPKLNFSRIPNSAKTTEGKGYEKFIEKGYKKIDKKGVKAVKEGTSFNAMANMEFEVMFNALDRTDEIQFRLLFSALAQEQLLDLMKNKEEGYNDNFEFIKRGNLNFLYSELLNSNLLPSPDMHISYDFEVIKKSFVDFNNNFFKNLFFIIAPILSIPMYQQFKVDDKYDFDEKDEMDNVQLETIINSFDRRLLENPNSMTDSIYKVNPINNQFNNQELEVLSMSYEGYSRVDFVPTWGGDGRLHSVPVPWTEYIAVDNISNVLVSKGTKISRRDFYNKTDDSNPEIRNIFNEMNINSDHLKLGNGYVSIIKNDNNSAKIYDYLNNILSVKK
ncbi:MAG1210 family protein [[Acholeplasma] multilocale]|uniref:MAG1210 family protein n=1 Tax=[Acholeplasma] multilocale TaxID=264638 RepID=UPI00047C445E|nr:hypothetical protein [[Acholeplasma] multilocale]